MTWVEWLGHASFSLTAFSFCVRDIVILRVLAVFSAVVGIIFNYHSGPIWLVIYWLGAFSLINAYQIFYMYIQRKNVKFNEEEKELFETMFQQMTAVEFMKLLKAGEWVSLDSGEALARQDEKLEDLYLIYNGSVAVSKNGRDVAEVRDGALIGEVSFLREDKATADAIASMPTKCLRWKFNELKSLLRRNPTMHLAMQGVFSADLTKKLGSLQQETVFQ